MTKDQLKQKMLEFIDNQDNLVKDEWWWTDRAMVTYVLNNFAESLKINLEIESEY